VTDDGIDDDIDTSIGIGTDHGRRRQ